MGGVLAVYWRSVFATAHHCFLPSSPGTTETRQLCPSASIPPSAAPRSTGTVCSQSWLGPCETSGRTAPSGLPSVSTATPTVTARSVPASARGHFRLPLYVRSIGGPPCSSVAYCPVALRKRAQDGQTNCVPKGSLMGIARYPSPKPTRQEAQTSAGGELSRYLSRSGTAITPPPWGSATCRCRPANFSTLLF